MGGEEGKEALYVKWCQGSKAALFSVTLILDFAGVRPLLNPPSSSSTSGGSRKGRQDKGQMTEWCLGLSETNRMASDKERGGAKRSQELALASAPKEESGDSRKRRRSRNLSASGEDREEDSGRERCGPGGGSRLGRLGREREYKIFFNMSLASLAEDLLPAVGKMHSRLIKEARTKDYSPGVFQSIRDCLFLLLLLIVIQGYFLH